MSFKDNPLYTLINVDGITADGTHQKTLEFLKTPEGSAAVELRDDDGSTYLHRIAAVQDLDQEKLVPVIYQLACQGVDPNVKDSLGDTALHKCLKGMDSSWSAIQALVRIGTDLTIENNLDRTPVNLIKDEQLRSQFQLYGDGLSEALKSGDSATVEQLLKSWCVFPNVKKGGALQSLTEMIQDDAMRKLYEKYLPTLEFVKYTLAADVQGMKQVYEEYGDKVDLNTTDLAYKDYWAPQATPMPLLAAVIALPLGKEVLETLVDLSPNFGLFYKGIDPPGPVMFVVENATKKPSEELAKLVLEQADNHGDLSLKDSRGQTIAFHAGKRSTQYLLDVLEIGVEIWERDVHGHTVIDHAIFHGNDEQAKALQNYVIDMVFSYKTEWIEKMSSHGFDWVFNVQGADGKKIVDLAQEREMKDVGEMLETAEREQGKVLRLMNGVKSGDLAVVKSLLGADPKLAEYQDKSGRCILHQAVLYEQKKIFDEIMKMDKNFTAMKDNLGRTPLHYAAGLNNGETFYKRLVADGADEDAKDWNNLSSKDYKRQMSGEDHTDGFDVLEMIERERTMKYGAPVLVKLNYNDLVECIENQDIQGVKKVVTRLECPFNEMAKILGPSIDPVMFVCVRTGSEDIARLLIDTGADLEIFREDGTSLLDYARIIGKKDLHKIIGRKIKEAHELAMTPLHKQLTSDSLDSLEMNPILPEVRLRKVPPPSTIDARYLARNLGDILEKALAEIVMIKPLDPIEYLARYLQNEEANIRHAKEETRLKYELEKERINAENERRRKIRHEIEAEQIQRQDRERRKQQKIQEEKEKATALSEESVKRERTEEKYAHVPDLATVNEDPREEDTTDKLQGSAGAMELAMTVSGIPADQPEKTEEPDE